MIDAAVKAISDLFTPRLRGVLMKSVGLALLLILLIGIGLQRLLAALAENGATWAEQTTGFAPHAVWSALAFVLSFMAGLGIVTGALFLMPTVAAFVGCFLVDDVADVVERAHHPADPPGRALSFLLATIEGLKFAALTLIVYFCALPFILFAGLGFLILLIANAYLLGREYFELAAMRFRPPEEARAMRKQHAGAIFLAGLIVAVFVSIPIVNFATPVFAMAFMVHLHKRLAGARKVIVAR
jgi:uncharacterized protein involved in cysteine biosynthesis